MLYFVIYLAVGVLVLYGMAFMHIVNAEMKGYKAIEFWADHRAEVIENTNTFDFGLGLCIWPVRVVQAHTAFQEFYDAYEYDPSHVIGS